MARGRPRKPLEHHVATGAIYKNPGRFKARLEVERASRSGIQTPAAFLRETPENAKRLEIWNDLIAAAEGYAREEDKFQLEQLVYAVQATRSGDVKVSTRKMVSEMLRAWRELIDRRREPAGGRPQNPTESGFGEFA